MADQPKSFGQSPEAMLGFFDLMFFNIRHLNFQHYCKINRERVERGHRPRNGQSKADGVTPAPPALFQASTESTGSDDPPLHTTNNYESFNGSDLSNPLRCS